MSSVSSPRPSLNHQIVALAVPALGALIAEPLFVLIDSAMVGHLGPTSLAGLPIASTILTTAVGLFVFLAYATTATTARRFGAGDRTGGLRAGVDGMWLAAGLGVVACIVLWVGASWLVTALGARGAIGQAAVAYLRASAPGLPGMLIVYAATGTLRGLLDTRTPFVVATAGAVLNVALNATFLYVLHLGIAGSGLGTALSQTVMAVSLGWPVAQAARRAGVEWRPHRAGVGESFAAGVPLLVRTVSLRAAILVTVWAATALGAVPLAAHQIVSSLWNFAAFALDALAIAAQALIGTALGQQEATTTSGAVPSADRSASLSAPRSGGIAERGDDDPVVASGSVLLPPFDAVLRRCLAWGVGTGGVIGVVMAASCMWLPRLFSSDAPIVATAMPSLLVIASAMPLAGAVFLFDGVLMGAGDGRYLAWAGVLTLVPYVPLAMLVGCGGAGVGTGALAWLWVAFSWVFMAARACTTGLRARSDAWRQ